MNLSSIAMVLTTAACTVSSQMLLKGMGASVVKVVPEVSLDNMAKLVLFALTQPQILSAVVLQALGFVLWIVVLSREHASVALGLGGASVYLLTALAEWAMHGVQLNSIQIFALIMVSVGALLLSTATP
ncbi:MAG: hypothetical protein C3F18_07670 [Nitrosomonadales bacterium]|nr:MAG: hypothetical protein C3F18_07670 [Nitrosomonadales bacterium]